MLTQGDSDTGVLSAPETNSAVKSLKCFLKWKDKRELVTPVLGFLDIFEEKEGELLCVQCANTGVHTAHFE